MTTNAHSRESTTPFSSCTPARTIRPLVRINKIVPFKHTRVFAKLEWYNPFGAVKDRIAANLLRDAERRVSSKRG